MYLLSLSPHCIFLLILTIFYRILSSVVWFTIVVWLSSLLMKLLLTNPGFSSSDVLTFLCHSFTYNLISCRRDISPCIRHPAPESLLPSFCRVGVKRRVYQFSCILLIEDMTGATESLYAGTKTAFFCKYADHCYVQASTIF